MLMVAIWLEEGEIGDSCWVWEFGSFSVWFEIWVTVVWCGVIVFRWVEYNKSKGFFFVNTFLVHDCEGDASNRSVFALILKPMQENQNKIKLQ